MTVTPTYQNQSASEALGLWEPRRTLTLEAARRHTERVKKLRWILIGIAGLMVIALIWEFSRRAPAVFPSDDPSESVKMTNPRFSGRTDDGLPFYLTAKEAVRMAADDAAVQLVSPVLEFYRDGVSRKSLVIADTGTYDDANKVLELRAAVELDTDDGYHCVTSHARIFTKSKTIEGDEPISCTGSFGAVKGNAYEIRDNYKTFIFKNRMSAVLEQN
ncbi:MAG: LPS export ABC transporter periplasmic protein LptC [Hellea sp.]|nr:LPS export ABC transporter periplasmic protein LptC [Hellea sp.]